MRNAFFPQKRHLPLQTALPIGLLRERQRGGDGREPCAKQEVREPGFPEGQNVIPPMRTASATAKGKRSSVVHPGLAMAHANIKAMIAHS